jgi:ketosteroid isomerase-like protein
VKKHFAVPLLLLVAFASAPVSAVAADAPPPPAAIMRLANRVLSAANANDASGFSGLYAANAVVVDENAPFEWRGSDAGAAWWRGVQAVITKAHIAKLKATNVRIGEFRQSANGAYLVESLTVVGMRGSKPFAEGGTMTYTFTNAGGKWLISTQVWTTKP